MPPLTEDKVVLVDELDNPIGQMGKRAAHQQPHLHRAFSVFVLRQSDHGIESLLQQRAHNKYHSPGLWTNACCSHPRPDEKTKAAATRRLQEELGISLQLQHVGHFIYQAAFDNGLHEHEFDHVFIAWWHKEPILPNPMEVADVRWDRISTLKAQLKAHPEHYTPWLEPALALVTSALPT